MAYQPIKYAIVYRRGEITKKVAWNLSITEAKRALASYVCAFGRYEMILQAKLEN